jgi:type VI secretion system protein ImpM
MIMFRTFDKAPPPTEEPSQSRASCCGKLPIHPEFIRHNLSMRETLAFERWLQEGVADITRSHPKGWPPVYRFFPVHHFVLSGSEQEATLIGALVSSRDKSGRVYPFSVFTTITDTLFQKNRATLPLVHRDFFRQSDAFIESAPDMASVPALTRKLEKLEIDTLRRRQRELLKRQIRLMEKIPMKHYWAGLGSPVTERERFWCAFYDVMRSVQKRRATRTNWGIRIPIPAVNDQTPFVIFWVLMAESILEDQSWRAHYFWHNGADGRHACVVLFFRPPPPSYLAPVLNHKLDNNAVFDLARDWRSLPSFKSRVDLRRLLNNDDTPMLDVLYRTGRREML